MNINLTLLGQAISFAIFVWFCMKFVWPVIIETMAERQKNIEDGLNAASKATEDLEKAKTQAGDELAAAKDQAAGIIEQANKRASQIVEDAKDQARTEGDRLKHGAEAEIVQEMNRAKESLRAQVSALAIAGAEKILGETVDLKAHSALVDDLAAKL